MNYSQDISQLVEWFNQLSVSALLGLTLTLCGFGLLLLTLRRPRRISYDLPLKNIETRPETKSASVKKTSGRLAFGWPFSSKTAVKADELRELQRKIEWQNNAISLLGERVLALEEYLEMVGSRQQVIDIQKRDQQFYRDAIELVDQGVSSRELAEKCGIPASEAELLSVLYRKAG